MQSFSNLLSQGNAILVNKKFGHGWYLKELHILDKCACSFCDKVRTSKFPLKIWFPAFKYLSTGWHTLVYVHDGFVTYWRLTL